jgi:hypothetical protein
MVVVFVESVVEFIPEMVEFDIESVELANVELPSSVEFVAIVPFVVKGRVRVASVEGFESHDTKAIQGTGVEV